MQIAVLTSEQVIDSASGKILAAWGPKMLQNQTRNTFVDKT